MKTRMKWMGTLALALAAFGLPPQIVFAQQNREDMTIEPRGPVHEGYAQPGDTILKPGLIVPQQPPEPIPEQPPDQRPEGDNVIWIPGYWAWDLDRKDFLWVSGFWRVPPPERKWVPGYWAKTEDGWQWISGFWADDRQNELYYQEPPPESLDYSPPTPRPDEESFYVPGCWVFRSERYVWRPGYWRAPRPGLVWCPAHYCYTPNGCLFVDGYWDRCLEDRGLLFAPVYFNRTPWTDAAWFYRPSYCVTFPSLLGSLFVRPAYGHYYFGDFYGPAYRRLGFSPWFVYGRRHYDPLFSYYRWQNRNDPGWYRGLRTDYRGRLNGSLPRPPRTLVQQDRLTREFRGRDGLGNVNTLRVVQPLGQVRGSQVRLMRVNSAQQARQRSFERSFRQLSANRQRLERPGRSPAGRPAPLSLSGTPSGSSRPSRYSPSRSGSGPRRGGPSRPGYSAPRPSYRGYAPHAPSARPPRSAASPRTTQPRSYYRPESSYRGSGRYTPYRAGPASPRSTAPGAPRATPRPPSRGVAPSRPQPRSYSRPAPTYRSSPRAAPRPAPRSAPRPAAKPAPRPAPTPAARPAPRPAPRAAPRPAPRPTAKPAPRPSGGGSHGKPSGRKR
jgi:hypothetical protein